MQDEFRYAYLSKTLVLFAIFAIIDLISSFTIYNVLTYDLIYPVDNVLPMSDNAQYINNNYMNILSVLTGLIGFIIFYIRVQKKRTPFNFLGFIVLHIITVCLVLYFMLDHVEYFFTNHSLLYSALDIFSFSDGFVGWIWMLIIFLGLSSQTFSWTIIRWKDRFINKQIAINYIVQLSKLSLTSVLCMCFIAILPLIFLGFVAILN
ncbi:MAG: hypothetical protein P8Y99_01380 [Calditrichaceae bacterium]